MFNHLHNHTEYSLLDGAAKVDELVNRAKELGQTALAITDHRNMFGCISFYKACKAAGIKPIIGSEFNIVNSFEEKSRGHHLVLLAKNEEGYKNLCKLTTIANKLGFYYVPRIDKEALQKCCKGLVCLSACIQGEIPDLLLNAKDKEAKEVTKWYKGLFGDDFYLEVQDHGIPSEKVSNIGIGRLSKMYDIKIVCTNDCHYVKKEDAKAQEILLCLQTKKKLSDDDRFKFATDEFYLKSEDEMLELFPKEYLENTAEVVSKCNFEYEFGITRLPYYEVPANYQSHEAYLKELCKKGIARRYATITPEIQQRYEYELSDINKMGYTDYFLIVWDFINWAKSNGIPIGPGRGSGAGSIVAYAIGITNIDPLKYNLYFERFLNPERVSMPDFDIDMDVERREEVVNYVKQKYGILHVSQILTFGKLKARAAIRDTARVLDLSKALADNLCKLIGKSDTIKQALEDSKQLAEYYDKDEKIKNLLDYSMKIEGLIKNTSAHAAGVLICDKAITEYAPLHVDKDGNYVVEADMASVEALGLLKFDFLGLRNLTVERYTLAAVKAHTGKEIDLDNIDINDQNVYNMMSNDCTAVFQFESDGMASTVASLKPTNIEDLIAIVSLYRPGPMSEIPKFIANKHSPENIVYSDERLKPVLKDTYGCLVYQEQVMKMFQILAGYSLGRADIVRRAMSKKKKDVIEREKNIFINGLKDENGNVIIEGALSRGVSEEVCNKLMDQMTAFAAYAFNKSHAAAYSIISYQTAWLKYYYPIEYMCAVVSLLEGNDVPEKRSKYFSYLKNTLKINILPVDVNKSDVLLSREGNSIRYGLSLLNGVGEEISTKIVKERKDNGDYTSIFDFCCRCKKYKLTSTVLESVIWAGGFDFTGKNRRELISAASSALKYAEANQRNPDEITMFEPNESEPNIEPLEDYSSDKKAAEEYRVAKTYLTCSPLSGRRLITASLNACSLEEAVEDIKNGRNLSKYRNGFNFIAVISALEKSVSKKNSRYAKFTLTGESSSASGLCFEKSLNKYEDKIIDNACTLIYGVWNDRDENNISFYCNAFDVVPLDVDKEEAKAFLERNIKLIRKPVVKQQKKYKPGVYIKVFKKEQLKPIEDIAMRYPGDRPLIFVNNEKKAYTHPTIRTSTNAQAELMNLAGKENVKIY